MDYNLVFPLIIEFPISVHTVRVNPLGVLHNGHQFPEYHRDIAPVDFINEEQEFSSLFSLLDSQF